MSSIIGPSLRIEIRAVTGTPALSLSPLGTPCARMRGGSKLMCPRYGAVRSLPPTGVVMLTMNSQRPACGVSLNARSPCVVRGSSFGPLPT
jgi:hypothetical protein